MSHFLSQMSLKQVQELHNLVKFVELAHAQKPYEGNTASKGTNLLLLWGIFQTVNFLSYSIYKSNASYRWFQSFFSQV